MASIVVSGDTSGAITISAPAVAGTNTITLPAQTATLATLTTPSFATTIGVGGTTASASGAGISFPATQSASSDANTLDDYEEGTWTPTDTSGAGLTFSSVVAQYVKVGTLVVAQMSVTYPSTANGNQAAIGNLPFATANFDDAGGVMRYSTVGQYVYPTLSALGTSGSLFNLSGSGVTNATLSTKRIDFTYIYRASA